MARQGARFVADRRQARSQDGIPEEDSGEILRRAAELQHEAGRTDSRISRSALEAGAEAAGISDEFVKLAVEDLRREKERDAARRSVARRKRKVVIIVAALLFSIFALFGQMSLNDRLTDVEEKRAQLENVLQRRHDLIPNLIAVAEASAAHEEGLVVALSEVYQRLGMQQALEQRQALEQELGERARALVAQLRADPQASSMALFVRLSDEMAGAENRIAVERMRYNEAVTEYNRTARSFPVFVVRPLLGFPSAFSLFEASEQARQLPRFGREAG